MSNSIFPFFRPVVDLWHYLTEDQLFKDLNEFRGGQGHHQSWHSKFLRAEHLRVENEATALNRRFHEEPRLLDVVQDNILRLTVFSGFERLFALRQATAQLKYRFFLPDTNTGILGDLFNRGFVKGYFRGALLNFAQFLGVSYHSLLWMQGASLTTQFIYTSVFESLVYPLDTIKTMVYCDTRNEFKGFFDCMDSLGKALQTNGVEHLYRGIGFKLLYNAAFLFHLRNYYEDSALQLLSIPVWILSYGLLTLKTWSQIADTPLSFNSIRDTKFFNVESGLYRGVVPFTLLNLLFSYQFYAIYSHRAQDKKINSLKEIMGELKVPAAEKRWI